MQTEKTADATLHPHHLLRECDVFGTQNYQLSCKKGGTYYWSRRDAPQRRESSSGDEKLQSSGLEDVAYTGSAYG